MEDAIQHFSKKLAHETDPYDLIEMIKENNKVVVIDARSRYLYNEEHIQNAISLPHREMTEKSTTRFNKNDLHVPYCDGIGCNASTKGALKMSKLGFKVKELIDGRNMVISLKEPRSQLIPYNIRKSKMTYPYNSFQPIY